jgi:putative ABC transport system substrate-binding protein
MKLSVPPGRLLRASHIFIIALCCAITLSSTWSEGTDERVYVIGIANINIQHEEIIKGFREGLSAQGYPEGKRVKYLYKGVQDISEIEDTLKEFKSSGIDLMFTVTTPLTKKAAKVFSATPTPVLFAGVYDPVSAGLVASLSRPGRNITGIQIGGNAAKSLEWMKTAFPGMKKVLVPVHKDTDAAVQSLDDLSSAAKKLRLSLMFADVATVADLGRTLNKIPPDVDGIFVTNSIFFATNIEEFVKAAKRKKLPLGGSIGVVNGVHISFSHLRGSTGRQASRLAAQILGGKKASELPVEMTEYYLSVNLKSLRESGLSVPDSVLRRADEVIRE